MSLGVNEEAHFHNLASALGRLDWLSDTRFKERADRSKNAAGLVEEIQNRVNKKNS